MLKKVKDAMASFTAQANSLPRAELLRAVYDMAVHEFGAEAVGEFEEYIRKPDGYWTLERCKESALKFTGRSKWRDGHKPAYDAAASKGWLDICCKHMEETRRPDGYWTLDKCKESAIKFNRRSEWGKGDLCAYAAAVKNCWLDDCCAHMSRSKKAPNGYWTLEKCMESALNFDSKKKWEIGEGAGYHAAHKRGWIEECCKHMTAGHKPIGYWTFERCKESALRFRTRSEFKKAESSAFTIAGKNGWLDECCSHMGEVYKPAGYWTIERCKESALKFKTRGEWQKGAKSAYTRALKNGWLDECCAHMTRKKPATK